MDAAGVKNNKRSTSDPIPLRFLYRGALLLLLLLVIPPRPAAVSASTGIRDGGDTPVAPEPWPNSFHALLYMNLSSGNLQMTNLWYDWGRRRNANLIQKQLGVLLHDVEWNNGTSFYYTLPSSDPTSAGSENYCLTITFPVGIPRRDFMAEGANYLGRRYSGGFLCDVWEKAEFIWYYQDVETRRPVRWDFYDGISTHVMAYEPGAELLDEAKWQAPEYCFRDGLLMSSQSKPLVMTRNDDDQLVRESFRRLATL